MVKQLYYVRRQVLFSCSKTKVELRGNKKHSISLFSSRLSPCQPNLIVVSRQEKFPHVYDCLYFKTSDNLYDLSENMETYSLAICQIFMILIILLAQ